MLYDYRHSLQRLSIEASFPRQQRVSQNELPVTSPRMIGSRGTQAKFVCRIVESLCAKFGAFFQSVMIFSLNHLTIRLSLEVIICQKIHLRPECHLVKPCTGHRLRYHLKQLCFCCISPSKFTRTCNFLENALTYRFCYNFAIVEATMSSPRSRRRISEIISGGKLFGLM